MSLILRPFFSKKKKLNKTAILGLFLAVLGPFQGEAKNCVSYIEAFFFFREKLLDETEIRGLFFGSSRPFSKRGKKLCLIY